jgi:hypothetical protein
MSSPTRSSGGSSGKDDPKSDPASSDVSTKDDFVPTLANIDAALKRAHAAEAEASLTFEPSGKDAPEDEVKADPGLAKFRKQIDDILPVLSLVLSWHRMYHDRSKRGELDRQLDVFGYPAVKRDVRRNRYEVPEDRQKIYDALAGVG